MKDKNPWMEICPGIKRQTAAHGRTMYQMSAQLAAGSKMPEHRHPQEQIVHILSGRMKLIVDATPHELKTGDSFYLASNVPHSVETIEETRVLDTFSPPRDEYLAMEKFSYHSSSREAPIVDMDRQLNIGAIFSSPLIADGVVYFASTDGYVYALE